MRIEKALAFALVLTSALAFPLQELHAGEISYVYDEAGNRISATLVGISVLPVDPAVSIDPLSSSVVIGHTTSQVVTVTNNEANTANALTLTFSPAVGFVVDAVASNDWACPAARSLSCSLPALAGGASSSLTIDIRPVVLGAVTTTVSLNNLPSDTQSTNNTAIIQLNVLSSATSSDTDGDGMPDAWELQHGLDPFRQADAHADGDRDGLENLFEFTAEIDPNNSDTDGDGIGDQFDNPIANSTNAIVPVLKLLLEE